MARKVTADEKAYIISLLIQTDKDGSFTYGQRELERQIEVSRPYLRKLAKIAGRTFDINGVTVLGTLSCCVNCGTFFRRSQSKLDNKKHVFCCDGCRIDHFRGVNHPSWKTGASTKSFSTWVTQQSEYKHFREKVLERDGYACVITGATSQLEIHHLIPKREDIAPEKVFDISNGITISKPVHTRIHQLISQGKGFIEAVDIVKEEYKNEAK